MTQHELSEIIMTIKGIKNLEHRLIEWGNLVMLLEMGEL